MSGLLHGTLLRSELLGPIENYENPTPYVELGWPGRESRKGSLDIFVIDNSGSVTAPCGSDPIGNRFAEIRYALEVVRRASRTNAPKAVIVHFDHPAGASGVQMLGKRRSEAALDDALRIPARGNGTSDLGPALDAAYALAATHADHDVRVTVLSDFALTDNDTEAVFARLIGFHGLVHAVILGSTAPAEFDNTDVLVTEVSYDDPAGTVADAAYRSLVATRRAPRPSAVRIRRQQPGWITK